MVLDSIWGAGTDWEVRLSTLELVFPRYILPELGTHRIFSKNASSSRAIPTAKAIMDSSDVYPVRWGKNQKGMQPSEDNLSEEDTIKAKLIWERMMNACKEGAAELAELKLHKQWASRPLEWFSTIKVLVSSTEWENFFFLRDHPAAQDEIHYLTHDIKAALKGSTPVVRGERDWHIPYVEENSTLDLLTKLKVSSARCARTSYKTVFGVTSSLQEDIDMFSRLCKADETEPFHASPTEHQARLKNLEGDPAWKVNNFSERLLQFRQVVERNLLVSQDMPFLV